MKSERNRILKECDEYIVNLKVESNYRFFTVETNLRQIRIETYEKPFDVAQVQYLID